MRIDAKLNLIVPVDQADGSRVFVHVTPVSREVFETYYLSISRAFTEIYTNGLNVASGPKVAALVLKDVATRMGVWDTPGGVRQGLVEEIRRLSNVVFPGPGGWSSLPLMVAVAKDIISEEDAAEAEGVATFFILNCLMHKKKNLAPTLTLMSGLWETQTSSSGVMEFAGSLRTSTEDASTGATLTPSSVPS